MDVGRTLYYDKTSGNVLVDTGERQGAVIETTEDNDFSVYPPLQGVSQSSVGILRLSFGEYATEYQTGYITDVNPTTQAVVFTPYPATP